MQSSNSDLPRFVAPANEMTTMAQSVSTPVTRRSVVAGLAVAAAPATVFAAADKAHGQSAQTAPEKSLYERLGGVFAIAAVVDHFSDAVVKPSSARSRRTRSCGNGTLRTWQDCPVSNSCGHYGSVMFRVGLSTSRPPSPVKRRLALKRPIGTSAFPPQNLMKSQQNSDERWTSPRSRGARRPRSWQPSPPTRRRSPPATSPPSPAENILGANWLRLNRGHSNRVQEYPLLLLKRTSQLHGKMSCC